MTDIIDRAAEAIDTDRVYYEGDVLAKPLDIRAGVAVAPSGPGLGIEWDEASLELYADR